MKAVSFWAANSSAARIGNVDIVQTLWRMYLRRQWPGQKLLLTTSTCSRQISHSDKKKIQGLRGNFFQTSNYWSTWLDGAENNFWNSKTIIQFVALSGFFQSLVLLSQDSIKAPTLYEVCIIMLWIPSTWRQLKAAKETLIVPAHQHKWAENAIKSALCLH